LLIACLKKAVAGSYVLGYFLPALAFALHGWQRRKWAYLYRAIDSHGDTLYFMLSERRDEDPATAFFKQAINNNGFPDKVVMDKSGAVSIPAIVA
jgi:hypothetical protein